MGRVVCFVYGKDMVDIYKVYVIRYEGHVHVSKTIKLENSIQSKLKERGAYLLKSQNSSKTRQSIVQMNDDETKSH